MTKKIVISKGNSKVGNIPSFSLPALTTCPGKSDWCSSNCYANKISRIYTNVRNSYTNNFESAEDTDFTSLMDTEIKKLSKKKINTFRIHVSGDMYSNEYIDKWISLIKANPSMTFYSYTRSWRESSLLDKLTELKNLNNMTLFASVDNDLQASIPMLKKEWRIAYAADTMPTSPTEKYVFCPEQAGKKDSCEQCTLCFNINTSVNIYFETH